MGNLLVFYPLIFKDLSLWKLMYQTATIYNWFYNKNEQKMLL